MQPQAAPRYAPALVDGFDALACSDLASAGASEWGAGRSRSGSLGQRVGERHHLVRGTIPGLCDLRVVSVPNRHKEGNSDGLCRVTRRGFFVESCSAKLAVSTATETDEIPIPAELCGTAFACRGYRAKAAIPAGSGDLQLVFSNLGRPSAWMAWHLLPVERQ